MSTGEKPMSDYELKQFSRDKVIFAEGTVGQVAYILKQGSVEISVSTGDNKTVLTILTPPAVFGDMALLLQDHKRTATATAKEDCEVVEIKREAFDDYISKSPQVIASLLTALAARLQETTMKATKVPDVFIGVCEILNLFRAHTDLDLVYDRTVLSLSHAFFVDKEQIKKIIDIMVDVNLLEVISNEAGAQVIRVLRKDDFLPKAKKIGKALKSVE
jgi:CRP-like cAMP-binding protein